MLAAEIGLSRVGSPDEILHALEMVARLRLLGDHLLDDPFGLRLRVRRGLRLKSVPRQGCGRVLRGA